MTKDTVKDTIIVGDLHGKHEVVTEILQWGCNIVFVGDYLDSFDRSVQDQISTLMLVMGAIEKEPQRIQGLLGNHELSYIEDRMRCSGFNGITELHVKHLAAHMRSVLKDHVWVGPEDNPVLVTHAGLTKQSVAAQFLDVASDNIVESIRDFMFSREYAEIKYNIPRSRGGWSNKPGVFWCDWWEDFQPIEGLRQACGHSAHRPQYQEGVKGIVSKGQNWNVDCLDSVREVLLVKADGSVKVMSLDV